jgi:hypothetical protein
MQHRRVHPKSGPAKKRPRLGVLIVFGSVACFGLLLLIVGLSKPRRDAPPSGTPMPADDVSKRAAPAASSSVKSLSKKSDDAPSPTPLIDDDGKTLWASPTDGPPLDLGFVSPGAQIILALRPQTILRGVEGNKVLDALGPTGDRAVAMLEETAKISFDQMERLVVGWQLASEGKWQATIVVSASADDVRDAISKLSAAAESAHGDHKYRVVDDWAYYLPPDANGKLLVVAPPNAMTDIIDLAGEPPPLRRDVERLLEHTDADRDVTIVVTPNSLFSDGGGLFEGGMTRLKEPLFWFLGDELSAAALSLHWDENFFIELVATPTLDTPPERAARILAERVTVIPDKVEAYVVGLQPQPYGRMVIARFPAMIRKLSAYTRSGFDSEHVVLNAYLPAVAGHNLLMAAELTLAEAQSGVGTVADLDKLPSTGSGPELVEGSPGEATTASDANSLSDKGAGAVSVAEKLRRRTTLRFGRDTLDAALRQLSQDIGVSIVIRGPDLQADGITKNQSFGIDVVDKPAEEVLVQIVRLANPDKTASGPNDVKQKLVYVIHKNDAGGEQIIITTRAAATARGDQLPDMFRVANP